MPKITENLKDCQKKILLEFKSNLKDILTEDHTDSYLLKYLKTRNFNLKEAEKIFRINYYNRITCGINDLLDYYEKPQVAEMCETLGVLGFAKDGTIIRYVAAGRLDFYGFIMSMSCFEICLYFSYIVETNMKSLREENLKTGKNLDEITFIFDMDGFSIQQVLHQNVIECGIDYTRLVQECYPLHWSKILVVNAPMIFHKAFNIFKPVMRSGITERMVVAGRDSTKDVLLEYIDADVLPVFLGGKKVDSNGDPYCKEFISFGCKVPQKFYSINCRTPLPLTDPDVQSVVISPRSVYNYPMVVQESNSKISFQYRTENGSLWVTLLYKEFDTDRNNFNLPTPNEDIDDENENCKYKQIMVAIRGQHHCCQEDALVRCPNPGIYVLKYSNSGNWFTSRKLVIRHKIIPPKQNSPKLCIG